MQIFDVFSLPVILHVFPFSSSPYSVVERQVQICEVYLCTGIDNKKLSEAFCISDITRKGKRHFEVRKGLILTPVFSWHPA